MQSKSFLLLMASAVVVVSTPAFSQSVIAPARIPVSERARLRADRPQRILKTAELLGAEKAQLGLGADDTFDQQGGAEDQLGRLHVRFARRYKGLRVIGGDVKAALSYAGDSLSLSPRMRPRPLDLGGSVEPAIGKQEAIDTFLRSLELDQARPVEVEAELVIDAAERSGLRRDRLAWLLALQALPRWERTYFLVDASTGRTVDSWAESQTDDLDPADGWGKGYYYKQVVVPAAFNNTKNKYELVDPTRGMTRVFDMQDKTPAGGFTGVPYIKDSNSWGNNQDWEAGDSTAGLTGQSAAADAMYGARITWDLLLNVFDRESYDGNGSPFHLRVHARKNSDDLYGDAHWNSGCKCATFGDGAKSENGHRAEFQTVAHELGHGFFNSAIGGDTNTGEKAGLNEGTGDIMAALANHYRVLAHGEGSYVPDGPDVSLYRTRNVNPWGYKNGFGGYVPFMGQEEVHVQGNVYARMFTILAAGGPSKAEYDAGPKCLLTDGAEYQCLFSLHAGVAGIGIHKAGEIFYLATLAKMDSTPTFHEAREDWLDAAADLFGENSNEYRSVMVAFAAIGIGDAPADTKTPSVTMGLPVVNDAEQSLFVAVNSDDDIGVRKVDIHRNAFLLKSVFAHHFTGSLDLRGAGYGTYPLKATVRDAAGKSANVQRNITYKGANYLLRDGGFEAENGIWESSAGQQLYTNEDKAFLGSNYIELSGDAWIRQKVTVPAGTTKLTLGFRVWVGKSQGPPETPTYLSVEILNAAGTSVTDYVTSISPSLNTYNLGSNNYVPKSFNLGTSYAGKTIWVRFRTSDADAARYRLDNVYLVYEAPISAEFSAVVDEADRTVTFRVKNITGTSLVKSVEIGSPGLAGMRLPTSNILAMPTSEFEENVTYTLTARLLSATGAKLAELGPVEFRVKPSNHRLANTSFEGGDLFWTASGFTSFQSDVGQDVTRTYVGSRFVRMGGKGSSHTDTLYQRAIMPADFFSAKLSFRLRIETNDTGGDRMLVKILDHNTGQWLKTLAVINGNTETGFDENGDPNFNGYRKFTYSLSEFKGRTIRVLFEAEEDFGGATTFYLDNAAVVFREALGEAAPN